MFPQYFFKFHLLFNDLSNWMWTLLVHFCSIEREYNTSYHYLQINNPHCNHPMWYPIDPTNPHRIATPQIGYKSLVFPPSPLLTQYDDIPKVIILCQFNIPMPCNSLEKIWTRLNLFKIVYSRYIVASGVILQAIVRIAFASQTQTILNWSI